MKRIISVIMVVCLVTALIPQLAFSAYAKASEAMVKKASLPGNYISYFHGVDTEKLVCGDDAEREKFMENIGSPTKNNLMKRFVRSGDSGFPDDEYFYWFELEKGLTYDEYDFTKTRTFYETVADNGRKNGMQLSKTYDSEDPTTWAGTSWERGEDGIYYLDGLILDPIILKNFFLWNVPSGEVCLGGALDFSGTSRLSTVWSDYNKYLYADFTDCRELTGLVCYYEDYNNDIRLEGCDNIDTIVLEDCGLTGFDTSFMENLVQLVLSYNDISYLDLSKCSDTLEILWLAGCNFSDIDLSIFPNLQNLYIADNNLRELNVSNNTLLNTLNCSGNKIEFLDVSDNLYLCNFEAKNCDLHSVSLPRGGEYERAFTLGDNKLTKLDLSGITGLSSFNCDNNYLTELDVSDCVNLHSFTIRNNLLKSINFGVNPFLQTITVSNNRLTKLEIPRSAVNFNRLLCDNNCLTELDVSGFYALWFLDCHNNSINKLDLAKVSATLDELAPSITCFDCTGNPIEELVNIPYAKSREAEGRYNLHSAGGGYAVARTERKLNSEGVYKPVKHYITAEPADGCSFLGWYEGDKCVSTDTDILVSYYHGTGAPGTTIECHFDYTDLTAKFTGEKPQDYTGRYDAKPDEHTPTQSRISEGCLFNEKDVALVRAFLEQMDENGKKNGEKLIEAYNSDKPESWTCCFWVERDGVAQLEALFLDNQLDNDTGKYVAEGRYTLTGTLNMAGAEYLAYVYLYGSEITSADFADCGTLSHLIAGNNRKLSDVNLTGCESLQVIDLHGCNLKELELSGKNALTHLYINDNSIDALDLSLVPNLIRLNCSNNAIAELDTESVPQLNALYCAGNNIKALDVHMCHDLCYLDCSGNGMETLETIHGFLGEKNYAPMHVLHCSDNALESLNIPPTVRLCNAENNSISVLNNNNTIRDGELVYFSVAHNKLNELIFVDEIYLITLDCSYNELEKLSFENQYQLTELDCSHNRLEKNAIPTSYTQAIRIIYYDCSYNNISEIDLAKCGNLTYYLNISNNPVTYVKNAPLAYIIRQAIWLGNKDFYRINIKVQGTGYIDYDLDTIAAIGDDFTGFYTDGTKLTAEKTLSTDGMENCTVFARFDDFPIGDINSDNVVNTGDAVIVLKYSAEMIQLSKEQKEIADVNGDDTVNTADAVLILKYAAGMITEF